MFCVVALAGVVGGPLPGRLSSAGGFVAPGAESEVAVHRLTVATGEDATPGIVLLVSRASRVREVAARLRQLRHVVRVDARRLAGRAVVLGTLSAAADDDDVAEEAVDRFEGEPDVVVGGPAVASFQIGSTVASDLGRAELIAFPILLLMSLLFFRGRATLMPLLVGAATVLGTFLVLAAVNGIYALNAFAINLVIGLGLGLAIDYTLFLVTRYREELRSGASAERALLATMRSTGRSVAFSAATVASALVTMTVFPQAFLRSMAIAGATVALVAAAASLTICPALFGLWGAKLARPHGGRLGEGRSWHRVAEAVTRRPVLVAAVTVAVMLGLALPALRADWSPIDASVIPRGESSRTVADAIASSAGREARAPILIALRAPPSAAGEVAMFARQVGRVEGLENVAPPRHVGGRTWRLDATAAGDPAGPTAQRAVRTIRALPSELDPRVGGDAAEFIDQQAAIGSRLAPAVTLLGALTLLLLWLMTRSVVLSVKALIMNALTIGAALAPLTLIYQAGRLSEVLQYTPNDGVEPTDFIVTAVVVFALSTDYGVFLLGRIKEHHHQGLPDREAVIAGVAATGRVSSAAAILLAIAIGAFATSAISFIQQIGIATATGVLIDAFVVRTLLVPSLMVLLGRWNWWSPKPLRR